MTIPKQLKLKLIFLHYVSLFPSAPVTLTLSEPAKSTRFNFATLSSLQFPNSYAYLICSMVIMKTPCDLDEDSFILVLAVALDLAPIFISSKIS